MQTALTIAAVCGGLYALHRLSVWAEKRGWIYYRTRSSGAATRAVLEMHAMMQPGIRHVIEARERDDSEEVDAGGPPRSGNEATEGRS